MGRRRLGLLRSALLGHMTDNSSTARVIIIIHGHDNKNCGLVIIILINHNYISIAHNNHRNLKIGVLLHGQADISDRGLQARLGKSTTRRVGLSHFTAGTGSIAEGSRYPVIVHAAAIV